MEVSSSTCLFFFYDARRRMIALIHIVSFLSLPLMLIQHFSLYEKFYLFRRCRTHTHTHCLSPLCRKKLPRATGKERTIDQNVLKVNNWSITLRIHQYIKQSKKTP